MKIKQIEKKVHVFSREKSTDKRKLIAHCGYSAGLDGAGKFAHTLYPHVFVPATCKRCLAIVERGKK